jgi:hypothetical protein
MVEEDGKQIWLAWSLATGYVLYFMVSVMEFICGIIFETGNLGVALWYYRTIGYWGSFAYCIPFILAIIQVGVEGYEAFPGSWALLLVGFFGFMWLSIGACHIWLIEGFMAHVEAQEPTDCVCDLPAVPELPALSTSEVKSAWEAALLEREERCTTQLEACNVRLAGAADTGAEEEEGASAFPDDEEDEDFEL